MERFTGTNTPDNQPSYAALNAVANAMMATQLYWLSPYLYLPEEPQMPEEVIKISDRLLQKNSARECETGSLIAIDFLARKHQDLFSHIFLLVSYRDDHHPFTHFIGHSHVAYFVARDKNGFYHAATPGNDTQDAQINPLIHAIPPSQNLADVIKEIKIREGGTWSSAEYIESKLLGEATEYEHPHRTDERFDEMNPAGVFQRVFIIENDKFGNNDAYANLCETIAIDLLQNPAIALTQLKFEKMSELFEASEQLKYSMKKIN